MPKENETPPEGNVIVTPIDMKDLPIKAGVGAAPSWYLWNLSANNKNLSFNYATAVSNPYSAGAWWVLWSCSMRDYAYYNEGKAYWNWLPDKIQNGNISYDVTLNSGQLYTVALFKNNSWGLADYIEFQA